MRGQLMTMLRPASSKEFMVAIDDLFKFARAFRLGNVDAESATGFFYEAVADVPIDILRVAVKSLIGNWRWGNRMPLPADLRASVPAEFGERKHALANVERSLLSEARRIADEKFEGRGWPDYSPEERAAHNARQVACCGPPTNEPPRRPVTAKGTSFQLADAAFKMPPKTEASA